MRISLTSLFFLLLGINTLMAQQVHDDVYHPCAHTKAQMSFAGAESYHPLMDEYDVKFYHLDLEVTSQSTTLGGSALTRAEVTSTSLDTIMLDLMSYMNVDSVVVDGVNRAFSHSNNLIIIPVPPISNGTLFDVEVFYYGTPPSSGFFTGISSAYNSTYGKRVTWTLSEPFNARHWWPCKQDLQDKADSSWAFFTTDDDEMVGSNGLLSNVVNVSGGKKRYEWKSRYPIAYYLISFAVSDYQDYSIYAHPQGLNDSILIQNFVYDHPNYLPNNQSGIDASADMVEVFSELMGMYPFHEEKYGHCVAQIGGGMEHQTMSTMANFGFELTAHELGHMWFGDNVTCATWSDIWINEGFATYSEYLAHENLGSPGSAYNFMLGVNNYVLSQPDGSIYIPPSQTIPGNEWRIFNGRLSYNKGASILHMLRWEINDDSTFFDVFRTFQTQFADSVATGDDFRDVVNAVTGDNYTWFFDQWYYGEGYPTHSVVWHQQGSELILSIDQMASYPSVTPFFRMHLELEVERPQGDTLIRVFQQNPSQVHSVMVPGVVTDIHIDPNEHTLDMPGPVLVGLEDPEASFMFSAYPNPVSGNTINVDLTTANDKGVEYQILDLSGRVLGSGVLERGSNAVEMKKLDQGTYVLRITDGAVVSSRKIVRL